MTNGNETPKQMFQSYKKRYDALVNTYCQMRRANPLAQFPKIARAVFQTGLLMDVWKRVVVENENQKHIGE